MKNTLLITTLLAAGTLGASAAWTESQKNKIWEQDTDTIDYSYEEVQSLMFSSVNIGSTGVANDKQVHGNNQMIVSFKEDARYEISFEFSHDKRGNDINPASGMLSLVNTGNDVCIVLGNASNTMAQLGILLDNPPVDADIPNTSALEMLLNGSCGKNVYSSSGLNTYAGGDYQYTIIFETFADSNIQDKIYFGVQNENTGKNAYVLNVNASHLGCGGATEQVFDDIGFHLTGDSTGSGGNTTTTADVTFVGTENGVSQNYFKKWKRTATPIEQPSVPEPSAFGLLAGVGALALVAARRRRSRS